MLSRRTRDGPVPVRDITLYSLFQKARDENTSAEFLFMETEERVYTPQLWSKVDQYAKGLLALGLKRGDTLTVMACVSSEALCLSAAAISIGVGYAHPYAYLPKHRSICTVLPLVKPKVLVVGEGMQGTTLDAFCEVLKEDSERFPFVSQMFYDNSYNSRSEFHSKLKPLEELSCLGEDVSDEDLRRAREAVQPSDAAMHLFSSGSTGNPKCIVHSQYSIANEISTQIVGKFTTIMVTSNNLDELCGTSGIALGLAGYASKVVIGLDIDTENPMVGILSMAKAVTSESVEHLVMTSPFIVGFLSLAKTQQMKYPTVKTVMLGGQVFSEQIKLDIMNYMGAFPWTLYGMSEMICLALTTVEDSEKAQRQRIEGKMIPVRHTDVKIVDDAGELTPIGTSGLICIKKYSFLTEYKNSDPAIWETLRDGDGYIKTGDIGVMDEDGAIEIKCRHTDSIRFKIFAEVAYPGPIESALCSLPAIKEAQVVSVSANDFLGDELVYCLCLNEEAEKPSEQEIVDCILDKLDEMKLPHRIVCFDKLPRTANSRKVSKKNIKARVSELTSIDSSHGLTACYAKLLANTFE